MPVKECHTELIPLPPGWRPESMASRIYAETEKWWERGWTFVRADADALLESVALHFERELPPEIRSERP